MKERIIVEDLKIKHPNMKDENISLLLTLNDFIWSARWLIENKLTYRKSVVIADMCLQHALLALDRAVMDHDTNS